MQIFGWPLMGIFERFGRFINGCDYGDHSPTQPDLKVTGPDQDGSVYWQDTVDPYWLAEGDTEDHTINRAEAPEDWQI